MSHSPQPKPTGMYKLMPLGNSGSLDTSLLPQQANEQRTVNEQVANFGSHKVSHLSANNGVPENAFTLQPQKSKKDKDTLSRSFRQDVNSGLMPMIGHTQQNLNKSGHGYYQQQDQQN